MAVSTAASVSAFATFVAVVAVSMTASAFFAIPNFSVSSVMVCMVSIMLMKASTVFVMAFHIAIICSQAVASTSFITSRKFSNALTTRSEELATSLIPEYKPSFSSFVKSLTSCLTCAIFNFSSKSGTLAMAFASSSDNSSPSSFALSLYASAISLALSNSSWVISSSVFL